MIDSTHGETTVTGHYDCMARDPEPMGVANATDADLQYYAI